MLLSPGAHLADWPRNLAYNRRVLLDPRFGLPSGLIRRIDRAQRRFLAERSDICWHACARHRIVDGHGDLRPEHIWLGDPVRIIDCLEFNPRLRAVDPFDEIAFLALECERLGAAWAGEHIRRRIGRGLRDGRPRSCSSSIAAIARRCAHAWRSPICWSRNPRTPEKWPRLARTYLELAAADAARLERLLRTRAGR